MKDTRLDAFGAGEGDEDGEADPPAADPDAVDGNDADAAGGAETDPVDAGDGEGTETDPVDAGGMAEASDEEGTVDATDADGPGMGEGTSVRPTTVWDPAGQECAACGEVAERLWRQDDAFVCPSCKDWAAE